MENTISVNRFSSPCRIWLIQIIYPSIHWMVIARRNYDLTAVASKRVGTMMMILRQVEWSYDYRHGRHLNEQYRV